MPVGAPLMVLHLWDPHTPASPFGRVLATRFLLGMVHGITPGRAHLAHQLLRCGKRRLQPGGDARCALRLPRLRLAARSRVSSCPGERASVSNSASSTRPCTTTIRLLPSNQATDPVPRCCVVSVDSIKSVALGLRTERIGRLADLRMRPLCKALEVAVDCDRWLSAHLRASPRPAVGAGRRLAAVRS